MSLSVAALIPAYKEALHIADVVRRVRQQVERVYVVDDGSPDATAAQAREAGADVTVHAANSGKGAAIKTGLRLALESGVDYVLLLDGDGQHLPEEMPRFLAAAEQTHAGIWVGNRFHDPRGMPFTRRMTNRYMSWKISRICGQEIPDSQCGFRMIHRDVIPALFTESNGYEYETEMLIIAARRGFRIASVPVSTVYAQEQSKIRPVQDSIRFFKLLARYKKDTKL